MVSANLGHDLTAGCAAAALHAAVAWARQAGHPWSSVAAILGGTRQAAQQRFAQPRGHQ